MRTSPSRPTMLAGWLFADLFLVLVLVGLASMPSRTTPSAGSPSPTVSAEPRPSHTRPPGLDPIYVEFTIDLSPQAFRSGARQQLLSQVLAELTRRDPARRQVGFVLVFASDDRSQIPRAVQTATDVVDLLHDSSPAFVNATGLGYWNGSNNNFDFKIFLLN